MSREVAKSGQPSRHISEVSASRHPKVEAEIPVTESLASPDRANQGMRSNVAKSSYHSRTKNSQATTLA